MTIEVTDRWLRQTKRGGDNASDEDKGDCVRACMTSILGLPVDAIPNCHGEGWWERYHVALAEHGYCIAIVDLRFEPPLGLWIASVPSLNLPPRSDDGKPQLHSIVCKGYDFVHDPSIGERCYDAVRWVEVWNAGQVAEGWLLAPLDPAVPA